MLDLRSSADRRQKQTLDHKALKGSKGPGASMARQSQGAGSSHSRPLRMKGSAGGKQTPHVQTLDKGQGFLDFDCKLADHIVHPSLP
jgi:hypothetical protein